MIAPGLGDRANNITGAHVSSRHERARGALTKHETHHGRPLRCVQLIG
jgi:hypothetical protein